MKREIVFAVYLASSLCGFGQAPSAQKPATSPAAQPPAMSGASASDDQPTKEQLNENNIQLMRADIRSERKKIVAENLPLTETEATKFWPLYDRYIGETIKVNDQRYALIKEYAQNYGAMTDAQANSYIKRWVALDGDNTNLRLKYIPEFEKIISPKKTAMFFQIDRRLGMMIELQLASGVPLVKP